MTTPSFIQTASLTQSRVSSVVHEELDYVTEMNSTLSAVSILWHESLAECAEPN